jgi:uncharacterized protein
MGMSVAASSNDEAEAEAIRRAQRAHEPSMEEILASIRAIIADDREPPAPKPEPVKPQIVYSADAPVKLPEPLPAPTVVWSREPEPPPPPVAADDDPPLMSEDAEDAVADAFQELSESLTAHSMEVAERMAREMLRPMLKAWLDENMPPIVERLVKAEIQRLARLKR